MASASVTFGGLTGIEFMSFTMNRGVHASGGVIICENQAIPSSLASATFSYTKNVVPAAGVPVDHATAPVTSTILLPDCLIDGVSASSQNPHLIEIRFFDRRWRWGDGHIDGLYNVKLPDGTYRYEKTAKQLMELCLDAMGETGYTTIAVDSLARPAIDWRGDNPALMLQELCSQLGYVVAFNATNQVVIHKEGVGTALPATDGSQENEFLKSLTVQNGALPTAVRVACGNIQYQCMMLLEPVGLEPNGEIKPIASLSYTPAGGWDPNNVPTFPAVVGATTVNGREISHNELARKSVYKWWQAKNIVGVNLPSWKPPGFVDNSGDPEVITRDDVLPLKPYRNSYTTEANGKKTRQRFQVTGVFYLGDDDQQNSRLGTPWNGNASLDGDTGVVKLDKHALLLNTGVPESWEPAQLYLTCVVEVNVAKQGGNQKQYWGYTLSVPGGGAGVRTIDYPDIEPLVTANYNALALQGATNNLTDVNAVASYYATAARDQLQPSDGQVIGYESFRPIALDGIRRQVRWSFGSSELPRTVATANTEIDLNYPTYSEITAEAVSRAVERRARRRDRLAGVEAERPQGGAE